MNGPETLRALFTGRAKKFLIAAVLVLIFTAGYRAAVRTEAFELVEKIPFHRGVHSFLFERVVEFDPLPAGQHAKPAMIYVLGGSQGTLGQRFRTAAMLYGQGYGERVFILSKPGYTEKEPALTNDAWALRELKSLGVSEKDIETVSVTEEYFGTMSEAMTLPGFAAGRGFSELALVTSVYHTKRAKECFSAFMPEGLKLKVYPSAEDPGIRGLAREYGKLLFYRIFLI